MAHFRKRFILDKLEKTTAFSPITGVVGHRQVGKTTLLQHYSNHYYTLDDEDILNAAHESAKKFISSHRQHHTVIDECQLVPSLFPALKEAVRKSQKPGQYIISGSVRFTSRKAIRESLTGRIVNIELLPFTISEIQHLPLPNICTSFIKMNQVAHWLSHHEYSINKSIKLASEINLYLERGGLPNVCFVRNESIRRTRILEQLQTILDRDIRLVYPTTLSYSQIFDFVVALAQSEGEIIRFSEMENRIRITEMTQKKILTALEAVFLIRLIPCEGGRKGFSCIFEDQAESLMLTNAELPLEVQLYGLIYRHIRAEWAYAFGSASPRFFQFKTKAGVHIPLCLSSENSNLALILIEGQMPNRIEKAKAQSFFKHFSQSKALYLSRQRKKPEIIDNRSIVLPLTAIL